MENCVICLEQCNNMVNLTCTHAFCIDCLNTWRQTSNSCPLCRQNIVLTSSQINVTGIELSDIPVNIGFNSDEIIISYYSDGTYEKTRVDFSNRYNFNEIVHIKKFDPEKAVCVVYYNGKQKAYYIKKFNIETSVIDKKYKFISDERGSKLVLVSFSLESNLCFNYRTKKGEKKSKLIDLSTFVSIKGWQALGNKIKSYKHMSGFKIIETKNHIFKP